MNLVLKRHPFAVYYIRRQMVDPSLAGHRSRCNSSISHFSEEEDTEGYLDHRSLDIDLPDDFVPNSFSEEEEDSDSQCGRSFEQSMPMEFFTQRCSHWLNSAHLFNTSWTAYSSSCNFTIILFHSLIANKGNQFNFGYVIRKKTLPWHAIQKDLSSTMKNAVIVCKRATL